MDTIVLYTDTQPPQNLYPIRIISPSRSGPCCFMDMATIGVPRQDGHWVYQYRRCQTCGYAVRLIVRHLPDDDLIAKLRKALENLFQRNAPGV